MTSINNRFHTENQTRKTREGQLNNATQFLNTWGGFHFFASDCCLLCVIDNKWFWPRFVMRISTMSHWDSVHTTRGIWRRSFNSTIRPTVHTNPPRKRSFSKTLFKLEEFENDSFSFLCGPKTFWKQSFSKTMTSRQSCDFPDRVFLNNQWLLRFHIFRCRVAGKNFMCFQTSENAVFKFLRHCVVRALRHKSNIYGLTSQMIERTCQ